MKPPPLEGSPLQSEWPDEPAGDKPKRDRLRFVKELPVLVLIAFGLALVMKTFLVQAFWIPSESMEPVLTRGDRVLVNKLAFRFREPRRGEVVVFAREIAEPPRGFLRRAVDFLTEGFGAASSGEEDLIKRVIGLPGETVEMRDGVVMVTTAGGTELELDEPYVAEEHDLRPFEPFVVPAGSYFMMGDNRAHSEDSRFSLGPVKRSQMIGKAFVKVWPPKRWDLFDVPPYGTAEASGALLLAIGGARMHRRRRAA
ncbi:MAG: signal peptidase I [Actinomycetota bacterium]